jgi:hypothetical protein
VIRSAANAGPPVSGEDSGLNMLATLRPEAQASQPLGIETPVLCCSIP